MVKITVCKTVAFHPEKPKFILHVQVAPYRICSYDSLGSLAENLCAVTGDARLQQSPRYVKNDTPATIVWDPETGSVVQYERLSPVEVQDLARLLQRSTKR